MRKQLLRLAACALFLILLPCAAALAAEDVTGGEENGIVWRVETKSGRTYAAITGYTGEAARLEIPPDFNGYPVVAINARAFAGNGNLRDVVLPEGLEELKASAFEACVNLARVQIPSTLKKCVTGGPFRGCVSLKTVAFNPAVSSVPQYLFQNCTGLTSITLSDMITTVEAYAFDGCTSLATVNFNKSLTEIDGYAFRKTALTSALLPDSLLYLGRTARSTSNENPPFSQCSQLERVRVPAGLITCGSKGAFGGCSVLDDVRFQTGIRTIPPYLFYECPGLTHIEIPNSVDVIGRDAFYRCSNLKTAQIPNSVAEIGQDAFRNSGLESLDIPDSVMVYGSGMVQGCTSLTAIRLSRNALDIPASAFSGCTSLESLEIPAGVETIKNSTCENCTSLRTLSLPRSITSIGNKAFKKCSALPEITLPGSLRTVGTEAFSGCDALRSVTMQVGLVSLGKQAFYQCGSLAAVALPDSVTSLGESAFSQCFALRSFSAGADLLTIGKNCFLEDAGLEEVYLNPGLQTVGEGAFQNCKALREVAFPESVSSLGKDVCRGDESLLTLSLPGRITSIPDGAFWGCVALTEVEIPKGVRSLEDHAFFQDTGLLGITLPESLVSISRVNAISYSPRMTVYGVKGSYAETWAAEVGCPFEDITVHARSIALANGKDTMTIGRGLAVAPVFRFDPEESTDMVTLESQDASIVLIREGNLLYGQKTGETTVTATVSGGCDPYTFTVKVSTLSGIEIGRPPEKTAYLPGEKKDLTGLEVNAVFSNGDREPVPAYDYTVSGFRTDTPGYGTATVTYERKTAELEIFVHRVESGTFGDRLSWTYDSHLSQVALAGPLENGEQVLVASYDRTGQLLTADSILQDGDTAAVASQPWRVQIIWADSALSPKEAALVENGA